MTAPRPRNLPSFTCPVCGMTSYNPNDVREGYCGNCHAFTASINEDLALWREQADQTIAASRRATYEDQLRKGNTAWLEINPPPDDLPDVQPPTERIP